ncbi:hypothetical protein NT934_004073 [Salmonella enterica]|nr:hypothetical protein [Salmonella enterica subsp. enterica serovar Typhimurium]EEB8458199.1 hypothetical protein [Salmonella enterica]ECL7522338.1 hypothetical protein [Salmonella enterica subsp. enterica serovar Typhimurium]EDN3714042.1 hypothetical protein [Salmonella enterica subsp. enterica serovar Typhimurium]EEF6236467.1 hypothetical protein [Salmonella enterica]
MVDIQISDGTRTGVVTFYGAEALEPCDFSVTGDFSIESIMNLFWLITATAEGTGQGIYPINGPMCAPYEMLRVFELTAVTATGVPEAWQEEMEAELQQSYEEFESDSVS